MSTDSLVFQFANDMLLNENPFSADVIFVHFDELDAAGHAYGFSKEIFQYRETLSTLDYYVNNLYSIIQNKRAEGENWLFILVSDHGGDVLEKSLILWEAKRTATKHGVVSR